MGFFLSHMDMGFPFDYGEVGLYHGDLGFLLGHRNEGFQPWGCGVPTWCGNVIFSLCQWDKGVPLSHREFLNQIFFL